MSLEKNKFLFGCMNVHSCYNNLLKFYLLVVLFAKKIQLSQCTTSVKFMK